MFNVKYILNFLLLMISTRITISSHQSDQQHHTVRHNFKSRSSSDDHPRNIPYRSDFRAAPRQEAHLIRNSNLTDESAQQPENGPPNNYWYSQYNSEYDDRSKTSNEQNSPTSDDERHSSSKYLNSKAEGGGDRNYRGHTRQYESALKDTPREKYASNQPSDVQYYYNQEPENEPYAHTRKVNSSQGTEYSSTDDRGMKYEYSNNNGGASQYSAYNRPEVYNREPSNYPHSQDYISDKNQKEQIYVKSESEYRHLNPSVSFSNSSSESENDHLRGYPRSQNDQMPYQDNTQSSNLRDPIHSSAYSAYRPETSSSSGYKNSDYQKQPYTTDNRNSQHYHTNSQKANSRLPQVPYSDTYSNHPEAPKSGINKQNQNLKASYSSEQLHMGDNRDYHNHQRDLHGQYYEVGENREKTHDQQPLQEESKNGDVKNIKDQENRKVSMRVVSTKKDMQPAPSEPDNSFAEEHDGFLDMGAYTDKQGSFGWYADFPVGKEHDKVTYSFS